jgi:hypothetical protein
MHNGSDTSIIAGTVLGTDAFREWVERADMLRYFLYSTRYQVPCVSVSYDVSVPVIVPVQVQTVPLFQECNRTW